MKPTEGTIIGGRSGCYVFLAAALVLLPVVACFLLPQVDLPGHIAWMARRGSLGPSVSLIPNDDASTGTVATVLLFLNFVVLALLVLALEARHRKLTAKVRPLTYWVALACVLGAYAGIVYLASGVSASVGPGGFAYKGIGGPVVLHRWPEVADIRRLSIYSGASERQPMVHDPQQPYRTSYEYKVVFSDGTIWESADSRNWAWDTIDRAMHRASEYSHLPIRHYRRRGSL